MENIDKTTESLKEKQPLSISDLSEKIRITLKGEFRKVSVRGEIAGFRGAHASGHCYFGLKDDSARIDAVMWRNKAAKYISLVEDGLEVIASGEVTTWPGASKYQLVIDSIQPAGAGAMLAMLAKRREKLAQEGLFDDDRKQLLPKYPSTIGVITSPSGAVIRDILHRIRDRFPTNVIIWPVRVQGDSSSREVANAVKGFEKLYMQKLAGNNATNKAPDVVIIARGGGSIEDLWGFNDEELIRVVSECPIPIISAVGHETDWTLLDLVADVRAPTPTAAAEFAVPDMRYLVAQIQEHQARIQRYWATYFRVISTRLQDIGRGIPDANQSLAFCRQNIDLLSQNLREFVGFTWQKKNTESKLLAAKMNLQNLEITIASQKSNVSQNAFKLNSILEKSIQNARQKLEGIERLAKSLSHHATMKRGFALVRSPSDEKMITSKFMVKANELICVEFHDGVTNALAVDSENPDGLVERTKIASRQKAEPKNKKSNKKTNEVQSKKFKQADLFE